MSLLHASSREQSPIQEWNSTECSCSGRAAPERRVQCSEKQWPQHAIVKFSAFRSARFELSFEECGVFVEPAFRLKKRKKEEARCVEQRNFATYAGIGCR